MYKFYMAHCINEIVCRYKLNQNKRKSIYNLKEKLMDRDSVILAEDITAAGPMGHSITLDDFEKTLKFQFGEYEAQRIRDYF